MPRKPPKTPETPKPPAAATTEGSRIGGRVKRYAKVSTTMAGLGARLAGQKFLGIEIDRDQHARQLMQSLGDLKGPLLKVAQLLATIPNALPPEYASELQKLQNQAPPMGWPFVRRRMAAELGPSWEKNFTVFEQTAAAAASLGQVHRATLPDGLRVACKLQYPDMASAVEADLNQLGLIMSTFEAYDRAIDTREIRREIADRLHEELDYTLEAKRQRLYGDILKDEPGVRVPAIVDGLSTARLLTSEWREGRPILGFVDAPQDVRDAIALNMFRAWYVPLYGYGIIHGDPHPGNYSVDADYGINLLDFGCVRVFPPSFIGGVIMLYRALQKNDTDMAIAAYDKWGFKGLTRETVEVLNLWARFLYGPVLDDSRRSIGDLPEKAVYGEDIATKVHQALRANGGVTIPREFVFMDRAALGLGSVFLRLQAKVNWYRLFNELIADFDEEALQQRQSAALQKFAL